MSFCWSFNVFPATNLVGNFQSLSNDFPSFPLNFERTFHRFSSSCSLKILFGKVLLSNIDSSVKIIWLNIKQHQSTSVSVSARLDNMKCLKKKIQFDVNLKLFKFICIPSSMLIYALNENFKWAWLLKLFISASAARMQYAGHVGIFNLKEEIF